MDWTTLPKPADSISPGLGSSRLADGFVDGFLLLLGLIARGLLGLLGLLGFPGFRLAAGRRF